MPRTMSRSVRYIFVAFAGALLLMAGVQSFGRPEPRMGLSTCGWDAKPCQLEGIVVRALPARAEPRPIASGRAVVLPARHVRTIQPALPAES
jgi:hypothetical protein